MVGNDPSKQGNDNVLVPFLVLMVGEVESASQGLVGFDLVHNRINLDDVATKPCNSGKLGYFALQIWDKLPLVFQKVPRSSL